MASNILRYDRMVEDALRGVLREALKACIDGLPGDHHFYITFRTRYPDVEIPDYMRTRYPDEMTIVLQHQYWGLEVTPDWFEVTLSFNRVNERLHIPFAAVSAFADPSAKFGLQFQTDAGVEGDFDDDDEEDDGEDDADIFEIAEIETKDDVKNAVAADNSAAAPQNEQGAKVITLDAFRKK